jgi:hypothetical protein
MPEDEIAACQIKLEEQIDKVKTSSDNFVVLM